MDLSTYTVSAIKDMLAKEADTAALLQAMRQDGRVSVQKLAQSYQKKLERQEAERERLMHMYSLETAYYNQGIYGVAGVDEAGRGPVAGPVMVAAVILPPYWECPGLNDSKKVRPENGKNYTIKLWMKPLL